MEILLLEVEALRVKFHVQKRFSLGEIGEKNLLVIRNNGFHYYNNK